MDPQQKIFTAVLTGLRAKGVDTYDGALPPAGVAYPFVYVADTDVTDAIMKNGSRERVSIVVHVWHNDTRTRGTFSTSLATVKSVLYGLEKKLRVSLVGLSQQTLADTTTDAPLLHGIVTAVFLVS